MSNPAPIFKRIREEMARAVELHGDQSHLPRIGGQLPEKGQAYYLGQERNWKAICADRHARGLDGWDAILLEEVFEALAETDDEKAIEELVQVAAMAVQTILTIQSQRGDS